MLYFIQQFWIRAEIMRIMLYFVQDFLIPRISIIISGLAS
jgi:hypothetical protein